MNGKCGRRRKSVSHVNDQADKATCIAVFYGKSSNFSVNTLHFSISLAMIALIFENPISRAHSLKYQAHI